MFQKISEFSRLLPESDPIEYLNEGMPEIYDRGLAICFDKNADFESVQVLHKRKGVIYRSGPSNGTDYTPCCKLAKTTDKRLSKAVKNLIASDELSSGEKQWLESTLAHYEKDMKSIWQEVETQAKHAEIDGTNHRGFVFWAKIDNGQIIPVYQWDSCRRFMHQSLLANWKERGGSRKKGACFVCGEIGKTVMGNFSLLACYNLDKIGSIAGGFKEKYGVKNFPVCEQCAIRVSGTMIHIQNYLTSSMAGQSYMILPYTNSLEAREEIKDLLTQKPDRFKLQSSKQYDLVAQEEIFLEEFGTFSDQMAFALIFFKQEKAAWRIQAEVQQVLPSRMRELHEAVKLVKYAPDLSYEKDNVKKQMEVNANLIRNFSEASETKSDEIFRSWLVALFEKKQIHYPHFFHHLVKRIISVGRRQSNLLHWTLRQAWALYRYSCLTQLIIPPKKGENMKGVIPESPYGHYITDHPEFFDCPEKAVAFLTGCYMSIVTGVQYKKRKSSPFAQKFVGRLLSRDHLKRLYQEGHNKLAQYDALGIVAKTVDPDLAQSWVQCGKDWWISDEETTFAFTIGYSLERRIRTLSGDKALAEITQIEESENESD
jgi:CRISPR-associated protein Csh1